MIVLVSCKPVDENPQTSNQPTVEIVQQVDDSNNTNEVRIWSWSETGLPEGVVYSMDCANCQSETEQVVSDNYVTIKRPNNYLTVVKDIDEDLYLNLRVGDVIQ